MRDETTHAALVMVSPGQTALEQTPTRRPGAGEILVAPHYVGVCGSDLDVLRGVRPAGARILGHEGVAEVVAVGAGVAGFSVGQLVTFMPNNPTDPDDVLGVSIDGLNQRYLLVSPASLARGMVVPLAPGLPLICGPLLEPLATVLYGQSLLEQVVTPQRMLIMGAGPIGLLNALCARGQGCAQVFLVDTSQARLDWASQRGAVAASHALRNTPDLVDRVLERTAGQGVDATYLCTPRSATRSALQQALRLTRADGGINLTAGADSSEELPELPGVDVNAIRQANTCGQGHAVQAVVTQQGKRLWLTGHSGASARYLEEAMRLLLRDAANYAAVISHVVPYRAAPRVFAQVLAAHGQAIEGAPVAKVIIDFTSEGEQIEVFEPQRWIGSGA